MLSLLEIKLLLEKKVDEYKKSTFIPLDPICIPHSFSKKQDIEISGFFAATLAWGNRTSIINSSKKLMLLMQNSPYDFILNHKEKDLKPFLNFAHRTFNATDCLYFIHFLKYHYSKYNSLELAFVPHSFKSTESALIHFHNYFFSLPDSPHRTQKHVSTPAKNSACKRLNMFLRWMVRQDEVDFGLWKKIKPHNLICPLDIHVCNVAYKIGLIETNKSNWKNAIALTNTLRNFDDTDPVKYDFALFSLGAIEKHK